MFRPLALLFLLVAAPAVAQVQSRPTDPPLVTAANESWFLQREPIQFAGDLYYPAGPAVFFDGNVMARTGHYNGVPLYVDTTIEPYSVVLVPVRRGVVQPYERRRQGDMVGTTGSRTPAFPVRSGSSTMPGAGIPQAAGAPTQVQHPIGAITSFTPGESAPAGTSGQAPTSPALAGPNLSSGSPRPEQRVASLRRPESNDGVWIVFQGEKWLSAGPAVPLRAADFRIAGQYAGFPVFVRTVNGALEGDMIYLPTRAGLIAPYRLK